MVANKRDTLGSLARALGAEDTAIVEWACKRSAALAAIADCPPDLVVVDEYIGYLTNFEFIRQLVQVKPSIRIATVSRLPRGSFQEVAAGLGILVQLPPGPGVWEAERLLSLLESSTVP
jgi:hypothetical protein